MYHNALLGRKIDTIMTQGERLKFVIKKVAYDNQALFARTCGVPPASVSKLIKGEYILTEKYASKFVKAYPSINPAFLLGESDNPGAFMDKEELELEVANLREENKRLKLIIDKLIGNQ